MTNYGSITLLEYDPVWDCSVAYETENVVNIRVLPLTLHQLHDLPHHWDYDRPRRPCIPHRQPSPGRLSKPKMDLFST